MGIIRSVYLECIDPAKNSAKFYQVDIDYNESAKVYEVLTRYGKIGNYKEPTVNYRTEFQSVAISQLNGIVISKIKKGYLRKDKAETFQKKPIGFPKKPTNPLLDRFTDLED